MLHRLTCERGQGADADLAGERRRFVLHRHRDEAGPHLDLRLEQEGYLMGFRVDGETLEGTVWATVKAPHPLSWLTQDGDAVREDDGTHFWESGDAGGGMLVLCGARQPVRVAVAPETGVSAQELATLRSTAEELGVGLGGLAALAADGCSARGRAISRFCGLGRELDGASFDEGLWRQTLAGERLEVVQQYLHALEVRFDRKYPPSPVSVSGPLPPEGSGVAGADSERAMGILRQLTVDS
jgi:hypothetical protein